MLRMRVRVQKRSREDAEGHEANLAGTPDSAPTSSPGLTATETEWRTAVCMYVSLRTCGLAGAALLHA